MDDLLEENIEMYVEIGWLSLRVHLHWCYCCISGVAIFITDYFENDIYIDTEDIVECNSSCEILWDKHINEIFTLLSNNGLYYSYQLVKGLQMISFYFKRLYECVVTMISRSRWCSKAYCAFEKGYDPRMKLIELIEKLLWEITEKRTKDI